MNIVLDTNCLIMIISPHSDYYSLWRAFLSEKYTLCISNEIIEEYAEVMARNLSPQLSEMIIYTILTSPNVIRVDPHFSFGLIETDKDDNKFVDCAIACNARCIVTEDKHFDVVKQIHFPSVDILNIDAFKELLFHDSLC